MAEIPTRVGARAGPVWLPPAPESPRDRLHAPLIGRAAERAFSGAALGAASRRGQVSEDPGVARAATDAEVSPRGVASFRDGIRMGNPGAGSPSPPARSGARHRDG